MVSSFNSGVFLIPSEAGHAIIDIYGFRVDNYPNLPECSLPGLSAKSRQGFRLREKSAVRAICHMPSYLLSSMPHRKKGLCKVIRKRGGTNASREEVMNGFGGGGLI